MGAPRYSEEKKQEALGALMASAVLVSGEWAPNFRAVAAESGLSHVTLQRWWKERDKSKDGPLRTSVARACEDAQQDGARGWVESCLAAVQEGVTWILSPSHRTTVTRYSWDGEKSWEEYAVKPDALARAYRDSVAIVGDVQRLTTGQGGDGGKSRAARLERMQGALKRTGTGDGR
jgi:hypothetical protein